MFYWLKIIWFVLIIAKISKIGFLAHISWVILFLPFFAYLGVRLAPALVAIYLMGRTLRMAKNQMDAMQSPIYENGANYNTHQDGRTIDGESRHVDTP
ncbi:MAG: hypothetical protein KGQ58_03880 [Proteobacteria bacterium]|nr:hypothetical protein [Pseudomonadota bacterium]